MKRFAAVLIGRPQTFRSGVKVVELDVSVLDRDRQPLRGLTAADFTVLVDGQPRPVVAFKAVDLPKTCRTSRAMRCRSRGSC